MKVVIIGGGFCGVLVAKKIEKIKNIETILIDKKSFFEFQPSLHKVLCKPAYISKLKKEYSSFLKKTKIIVETVTQVTENFIETTGNKIFFDILVISTGIDYPIFLKNKKNVYVLKNGKEALEIAQKIQNSIHVLLVGGGVIGTEIAGEIIEKFPDKTLTIVHSHKRLLERLPVDTSEYIFRILNKKGVRILLEDEVIENKNGFFITKTGKRISADICIWCAGIKCNPYYMNKFPTFCYSSRNALNVNKYLQLQGFKNIFIGGDITSIVEEKTARKSELHAKLIVKNIKKILGQRPLISYKMGISPMVISVGDYRGIILYKYVIPGLFFPGILKWLIQWWFLRNLK